MYICQISSEFRERVTVAEILEAAEQLNEKYGNVETNQQDFLQEIRAVDKLLTHICRLLRSIIFGW